MKYTILSVSTSLLVFCYSVQCATLDAKHKRHARQLVSNGASTLTVDSLGTPVMTTAVDAMGGSPAVMGVPPSVAVGGTFVNGPGVVDPLGLGFGLPSVANPSIGLGLVNTGTTLVDTSGVGSAVGQTAIMGEAVGNINELVSFYTFYPVDTTNSYYVLPPNLQAYIPDDLFLVQSPPRYDNYILACDLVITGMCYYYYF